MGVAVVFPGQGTQQPGMAAAWRGHPSVAGRGARRGRARRVARSAGHRRARRRLTRTREAQLAVLVTSLVAWDALEPLAEVPVAFAALARAGHR